MYEEDGWNRAAVDPSPRVPAEADAGPSTSAFIPLDAPSLARARAHLPAVVPASASTPPSPTRTRSDRPPRPMNAWLLFRTAQLRQMQEDNPGLRKSQGELSKLISEMWKSASPEVKQGYEDLARQRKVEHQRIYPDYRYPPANKPASKTKASKVKRVASSGASRATRPSLRLSPSQNAAYPDHGYDPDLDLSVGEHLTASNSRSTSRSATNSPHFGTLPTPPTASWTVGGCGAVAPAGYDDLSPPLEPRQPTFAHEHDPSQQQRFVGLPRMAPPQSAPPSLAHFPPPSSSSALGLSIGLSQQHLPSHHRAWLTQLQPSNPPSPLPTARQSFSYQPSHLNPHLEPQYISPPSSATHPPSPYGSTAPSSRSFAHRGSYADPAPGLPPLPSHLHSQQSHYWADEASTPASAYPQYPPEAHHRHLPQPHHFAPPQHQWHEVVGHEQPTSVSPMAVYGLPGPAATASGVASSSSSSVTLPPLHEHVRAQGGGGYYGNDVEYDGAHQLQQQQQQQQQQQHDEYAYSAAYEHPQPRRPAMPSPHVPEHARDGSSHSSEYFEYHHPAR